MGSFASLPPPPPSHTLHTPRAGGGCLQSSLHRQALNPSLDPYPLHNQLFMQKPLSPSSFTLRVPSVCSQLHCKQEQPAPLQTRAPVSSHPHHNGVVGGMERKLLPRLLNAGCPACHGSALRGQFLSPPRTTQTRPRITESPGCQTPENGRVNQRSRDGKPHITAVHKKLKLMRLLGHTFQV